MSNIRTLAGDTIVYGLSTIVTRMLNYLMFPYLTRVMGTVSYGEVGDLYSIIPFALVVLTMGLESGFFRFSGTAENEGERRAVFSTTWGATIFAATAFFVMVLLFNGPIAGALGYGDRPSFIWIMALIIMLDVITAMPFAKLRQERKRFRYAGVRLLSVVVNIVLTIFFFSALPRLAESSPFWEGLWSPSFGVGYVLVANAAASLVSLMALLPSVGGVLPRMEGRIFRRVMLYSLPLLISGIAGTGNEFIDRQLIKWLLPADIAMSELGVYTATVRLAAIMVLFTQMYRFAAEPIFLARFSKEDFARQTAGAMKYYILVTVFIFVGVMLFKDAIVLIAGPAFRGANHLLPVLLLANALAGVVLNLSFWYKQMNLTRFAIWITGTGFIVITALCVMLIPRFGLNGAAWSRLACEVAMVAVSLWLNRKYCRTPYDFGRIGVYVAAGALIYGAGFGTALLPPGLHYSLNAILILLFAAYAARKEDLLTTLLPKR